jgi:O-methyltransferase
MQFGYEPVHPHATYAPWLDDPDFQAAYRTVQDNTLVDHMRAFELWRGVGPGRRVEGDILEVGVWRGGTGCLMAKRVQALGSSAQVYLCDTFTGVVKAGPADRYYKGGEHADTSQRVVLDLAERLGLSNVNLLAGIFPDDTGDQVAGRRFSLCHIDVDVYESALHVLEWVWPRMPVGGVVVFDDYGFSSCTGVTTLVNDRLDRPGALTIHNLNGHAVIVKTAE